MNLPHSLKVLGFVLALFSAGSLSANPIKICASTPDVASLIKLIGGNQVEVFSFTKGLEDPHDVELRNAFVRKANQADALFVNGLDIEHGWIGALKRRSNNPQVFEGGDRYFDLGQGVLAIEEGEEHHEDEEEEEEKGVHEEGNPHYLLDPVEGLRSAGVIRDSLTVIRPDYSKFFVENHRLFVSKWLNLMMGETIAKNYDTSKLIDLREMGEIEQQLKSLKVENAQKLGGLYKLTSTWKDLPIVADHDQWPYFTRRFGLNVAGYIEGHPGVSPSPRHLTNLIKEMKEKNVNIILKSSYFPSRTVAQVARGSGAKVVNIAHQVQGTIQAKDYFSLIEWNVNQIYRALE